MSLKKPQIITVFEHEVLRCDKGEKRISNNHLNALRLFHGESGTPFFSLVHNGVKFNEHVGALQIGQLTIEILPKIDKRNDTTEWRNLLIGMLLKVGAFEVSSTGYAQLTLKRNSILYLYFLKFINEVEGLLHLGLIKKYRKDEGNVQALRGALIFSKHIEKNIVHKERFYVRSTIYDKENLLNQIILKTLHLIKTLNTVSLLDSKVRIALERFPELDDIVVDESLFNKLRFTRKTEPYRKAINIAKMLLLNYHPNLNSGANSVLALLFDMNILWERFVYVSLQKYLPDYKIKAQSVKAYWRNENKTELTLKPDIFLANGEKQYVIDTKWKLPYNGKPSSSDLQQMYAYTKYFHSSHTLLFYPGIENAVIKAVFLNEKTGEKIYPCSVVTISTELKKGITAWQIGIADSFKVIAEQTFI